MDWRRNTTSRRPLWWDFDAWSSDLKTFCRTCKLSTRLCCIWRRSSNDAKCIYFVGGNLISPASIPITLTPVLLVMMAQKFRHYSNFWKVYPKMPACPSLKTWKYVRLANNLVDAATAKIKFQEGCHPLLKSGNFWKKPRIKGRSGGWCFQSCYCCKTFLTIHRRCYVCLLMKILGSRLQAKSSVVTNGNLLKIVPFLS